MFLLATAVALLAGAGYAWDAIAAALLVFYTALCGSGWSRLAGVWASNGFARTVWTSALNLGSFAVVLTLASLIVIVFVPQAFEACTTVFVALFSSIMIAYEHLLGDDAVSFVQLAIYGLPFGLPLNIVVGLFVGAILGLVAASMRSPTTS